MSKDVKKSNGISIFQKYLTISMYCYGVCLEYTDHW